jgi:hypothetical protein
MFNYKIVIGDNIIEFSESSDIRAIAYFFSKINEFGRQGYLENGFGDTLIYSNIFGIDAKIISKLIRKNELNKLCNNKK